VVTTCGALIAVAVAVVVRAVVVGHNTRIRSCILEMGWVNLSPWNVGINDGTIELQHCRVF
jgi:hypothetical protein